LIYFFSSTFKPKYDKLCPARIVEIDEMIKQENKYILVVRKAIFAFYFLISICCVSKQTLVV